MRQRMSPECPRDWEGLFEEMAGAVVAIRSSPSVSSDAAAMDLLAEITRVDSMEDLVCLVDLLSRRLTQTGAMGAAPPAGLDGASRKRVLATPDANVSTSEAPLRVILRI